MRPAKIEEKLAIPEGVEFSQEGTMAKVKGPKGEITRKISHPGVKITKQGNELSFFAEKPTKREKKALYSMASHVKNMLFGVKNNYIYKLKICPGHFPPTVKVEGNELVVSNFLGGKIPKIANILQGVKVSIQGDNITVEGHDVEKVGQTAANFEQCTRIKNRDRRVFQAGIFITEKAGVPIR